MELEILWIMLTILIGAFLSAVGIIHFYRKKVITKNVQVLKSMVVGGICMVAGSLLMLFAVRTLMFMSGFLMVVVGILLIIGAVWSVLYVWKQTIDTIRRIAEK